MWYVEDSSLPYHAYNNEETFLQYFLGILKLIASEFLENLEEMFHDYMINHQPLVTEHTLTNSVSM